MSRSGTMQAIVATHSPLIAATPNAHILEVGEWGLRERGWRDLELVQNWQDFLDDPHIFLRHVID
jgi:predicted ATPase